MNSPLDAESSNRSLPGDSFSQGPGVRSPLGTHDDNDDVVEQDPSGRYSRYSTLVGAGRFKRVFRAFDERRGVDVAWAKIDPGALGLSPRQAALAAEEMEKGVGLNHPSVIRVFECWRDESSGVINMVTEFFTSGNLRDYRQRHKSLGPAAVRKWARQILAGLAYLHGLDPPLAHGDLRADKVYVNGHSGEIKIGDLGLASLSPRRFEPGVLPGDAPSEHYTPAVDVFALGLVIIEVTTGKPMGRGDRQSWHDALAGVADPEARAFAERCLAPPDERPTVFQLLDDPFVKIQRKNTTGRPPTAQHSGQQQQPQPQPHPQGAAQHAGNLQQQQQQQQQVPPLPCALPSDAASSGARLPGACSPPGAAPEASGSAPPGSPGAGALGPGPALRLPGLARAAPGGSSPQGQSPATSPTEAGLRPGDAPALHAAVAELQRAGISAGGAAPQSGNGSAPLSGATSAAATPGYCSPAAPSGGSAGPLASPGEAGGVGVGGGFDAAAEAGAGPAGLAHLPPGSPRRARSPAERASGSVSGAGVSGPPGGLGGVPGGAAAGGGVPGGAASGGGVLGGSLLAPSAGALASSPAAMGAGSADLAADLGPSSTVCEAGSVQGEDYLFQFSGKIRDGKLHFRLHMIFDGSVTDDRAGTSKTIEFAYDPDADTPDSIAAEISEEFHLSSTDMDICAAALREWLAKEMESHEL